MDGFFPILIKVKGKRCLVVGGGPVAERRIASLLDAEADVTVVSPQVTENIDAWSREGRITCIRRRYEQEDQGEAYLVIAATDSTETNEAVGRKGLEDGRLVNMAERPELGSFIVPSVVRRGKLVIAVSTSGASPAVSAKIRRQMEETFGMEYEDYLDFLGEFRLKVQELVKDTKQRQEWFRAVLELDLLEKIRRGEFEEWKRDVIDRLARQPEANPCAAIGGKTTCES